MITQWENLNSNRNYPFSEEASLISESGEQVPTNILVDATIVRGLKDPSIYTCVWVSSIHVSGTLISICFEDDLGPIASCSILMSEFKPYTMYKCTPMRDNVDATVTFGSILTDVDGLNIYRPAYTYRLDKNSGKLVDTAITDVKTAGVTRIIDDTSNLELRGDIPVTFNHNFISLNIVDDTIFPEITTEGNKAIAGNCNTTLTPDTCGAVPIKSLSGVVCNAKGEIVIRFVN